MSRAANQLNTTAQAVMERPIPPLLASPVPARDHHSLTLEGGVCPVRGFNHSYCPPQPTDKRSPCPALNTLANHGYLPRNGRDISPVQVFWALKRGYQLSTCLALLLVFGGWLILGQFRKVSLWDLSRHDLIEHDASLFHEDAHNEDEYAPVAVDHSLTETVLHQGGRYHPNRMTLQDAANIRVKREASLTKPLKWWQAVIARGEAAIAIGVLGGKDAEKTGLDLEVLRLWVTQERLPDGWKPDHTQGLFKTISMAKVMRDRMEAMKTGAMHNILDDERTPLFSPIDRSNVEKNMGSVDGPYVAFAA